MALCDNLNIKNNLINKIMKHQLLRTNILSINLNLLRQSVIIWA
ncbi:MAG: hypothetical protein ACI9EV_001150 [Urechidicola sp.]|jgi:hypothetical protein